MTPFVYYHYLDKWGGGGRDVRGRVGEGDDDEGATETAVGISWFGGAKENIWDEAYCCTGVSNVGMER